MSSRAPDEALFAFLYDSVVISLSGMLLQDFFTPIPCTYNSLSQDGMARNYYFLPTWIWKRMQSILFLSPYTQGEKKNIWSVL